MADLTSEQIARSLNGRTITDVRLVPSRGHSDLDSLSLELDDGRLIALYGVGFEADGIALEEGGV